MSAVNTLEMERGDEGKYVAEAGDVGSKIQLNYILYKVGVGTRCGEGKRHPDDGPGVYCKFPHSEMVVEDLCGNKKSCVVPVTETVFGEYKCEEETRYLEVSYDCSKPLVPQEPLIRLDKGII
ncbi:hypothetical protein CRUP_029714 [Coryphaenoides rupestris]|nr:hypothetical protein CRUP_029714 [Coryphaenoides rupestris]